MLLLHFKTSHRPNSNLRTFAPKLSFPNAFPLLKTYFLKSRALASCHEKPPKFTAHQNSPRAPCCSKRILYDVGCSFGTACITSWYDRHVTVSRKISSPICRGTRYSTSMNMFIAEFTALGL